MGASHFQMELANLAKCLFLGFMILWIQIHGCKGCFEAERSALLNFKKLVVSDGADADHLLSSWVDDSMSDCCKWERVTCNSTTSHVIELFLNNTRQHDIDSESFYDDENIWFIKLSMFQQLKELKNLNLSYNVIGGFIDYDEGFERLSELNKLETLDLTYNWFNNSILSSLGALTSLKSLILSRNNMRGSFPSKGFEKLEELDISYNRFNNSILSSLGALKSLKSLILEDNKMEGSFPSKGFERLEDLDISDNLFNKSILSSLGALTSLRTLKIRWNNMEGSFPIQELNNLKHLETLDISYNEFNGSLSHEGFERLEDLDISYNRFNNSILSSLSALTSLRTLKIRENSMEGCFPIQGLILQIVFFTLILFIVFFCSWFKIK
ncbi:receptor-like protein 15 isoform X2 [Hevea brasiliensis]|uniref:receptor-like protein 15 isoform X2 n=1 Tax=Hevea brasiliensis TaxID=3981 RepID=UPI0025E2D113|nr:receptor-like protein 15 isoform X2 [Hevea brasiliensis]